MSFAGARDLFRSDRTNEGLIKLSSAIEEELARLKRQIEELKSRVNR
jgi:hypothetical protein